MRENERELFESFQKRWNLDALKSMTLEEYTGTKKDNQSRDDFTYWIEKN